MEIRNIYRIIAFELKVQLRSKSFWLLSLIPPVAIVLIMTVNLHTKHINNIAIYNASGLNITLTNSENVKFIYLTGAEYTIDKLLSTNEKLDALVYLYDKGESGMYCDFYEKRPIPLENKNSIISVVQNELIEHTLGDVFAIARKDAENHLTVRSVPYQNDSVLYGLSTAGIFLIYFVIIQFASTILSAIGREKKNKISEILLTAMSGSDIMVGKLVSGFIAAILQVMFWFLLAGIVIAVIGNVSGGVLSVETIMSIIKSIRMLPTGKLIAFFVVFALSFTGGYFLYSTLFSFVGAISNENTNTRQFSLMLTVPLLLTFVYVAKNQNSSDSIMQFLTYFPLCSPIALLPGYVNGLSVENLILSFCIIFVTTAVIIRYSSMLYAQGILATRSKVTVQTIVKWLRRRYRE